MTDKNYHFVVSAVLSRCLSALKEERVAVSPLLSGPKSTAISGDKTEFVSHIRKVRVIQKYLQHLDVAYGYNTSKMAVNVEFCRYFTD